MDDHTIDDIEQKGKQAVADTKEKLKDAWVDTKAATEKAKNKLDAEVEKL